MVNVEADVLSGPYLAKEADKAGVVYSMAYGDQPALTTELVEWARASGFHVVAAGKGTKYLPEYHYSTPDTVWDYYGLNREEALSAGMNSRMFNSFFGWNKICFGNGCNKQRYIIKTTFQWPTVSSSWNGSSLSCFETSS